MSESKKPRGAQKGNANAAKSETKNSTIWISCTPEQKSILVKAAHGAKLVDFCLDALLEKADNLVKHITYDGCSTFLHDTPAQAVKAVDEVRGIQKYVTDNGEVLWSCEGRVTDCDDKESCLDVESWWDDDWTVYIDDYYQYDKRGFGIKPE